MYNAVDGQIKKIYIYIRSNVIVDAFNILIDRTLRLYDMSIRNSVFPKKWKTSIVVPLPKINNPRFAPDMRPISLIPLLGKILEHLISTKLKAFVQNHDTLTNCQHGFQKSHSTIVAISKLIHNIYSGVNN